MSTIDEIMSQAQEFASGWSIVGGRFDSGDALEIATESKAMLRNLIAAAIADAQRAQRGRIPAAGPPVPAVHHLLDPDGRGVHECDRPACRPGRPG